MKKEMQVLKINRETLEKLRNQNPDESLNTILGWTVFELTYAERQAKKLNIPLSLREDACMFIYLLSNLLGAKMLTITEVFKNEIENVNYEDAMMIFDGELI
jgi:hypothetical protein